MTMSLTLVNTSNWTHETIKVCGKVLQPGMQLKIVADPEEGTGVIEFEAERDEAKSRPHRRDDPDTGPQVFPVVRVDMLTHEEMTEK